MRETVRALLKAAGRTYADRKALDGAKRLKLPSDPKSLAGLVSDGELAALAAAQVRVALDAKLAREVRD